MRAKHALPPSRACAVIHNSITSRTDENEGNRFGVTDTYFPHTWADLRNRHQHNITGAGTLFTVAGRQHSIAAIGPELALAVKQQIAFAVCRNGRVQDPDGVQ
jgi:hypothetical protein